jgi:hypothetical protein
VPAGFDNSPVSLRMAPQLWQRAAPFSMRG